MSRLTQGSIDPDVDPETHLRSPFGGLTLGQLRDGPTVVIKDAVWYNSIGLRIGWGALSSADFQAIHRDLANPLWGLDSDEKFVVVTAGEVSGHYLKTHHHDYTRLGEHTVLEVGPKYLAEYASFVIARDNIYITMRVASPGGHLSYPGGLKLETIGPARLRDLILGAHVA